MSSQNQYISKYRTSSMNYLLFPSLILAVSSLFKSSFIQAQYIVFASVILLFVTVTYTLYLMNEDRDVFTNKLSHFLIAAIIVGLCLFSGVVGLIRWFL